MPFNFDYNVAQHINNLSKIDIISTHGTHK